MSDTTTDDDDAKPSGQRTDQPANDAKPGSQPPNPEGEGEPPAPPDDKPKPDPRDRAIRQLAFAEREAKRQLKELQDRAAQSEPPRDPNAPPSQADIERIISERVTATIAQREQAAASEAWIAKGTADYPDFNERCNALADMGAGQNPAFMAAIGKLPEGQRVISDLADHPAEAHRILTLPPVELALELAAMAARLAAAPAPVKPSSSAPAPIRPLTATSRAEVDPERMTEAQYQDYWNKKTRRSRR